MLGLVVEPVELSTVLDVCARPGVRVTGFDKRTPPSADTIIVVIGIGGRVGCIGGIIGIHTTRGASRRSHMNRVIALWQAGEL